MSDSIIDQTISHYHVIAKLGGGGMGDVYKARDLALDRTVALKFLPREWNRDREARARFIQEARAASALDHTNICTIYEVESTSEGQTFISMAYYEGKNLKDRIKKGSVKLREVLEIGIQIAQGLSKAHLKGIVHRDIKPANIMLTKEGVAKILDFGLAKLAGQTKITRTGITLGTVAYMSPEQARGDEVDERSDIWSLGVVLYELASGRKPFKGEQMEAVIYGILCGDYVPLTQIHSDIPVEFQRLVDRCLEKDPEVRCQSAADLMADLRRLRRDLDRLTVPGSGAGESASLAGTRKWRSMGWKASTVGMMLLAIWGFSDKLRAPSPDSGPAAYPTLSALTSGENLDISPSWSPDGKWVAYGSDKSGNMDIWKQPVEGGKAIPITSSTDYESQPAWSPDGRTIAFSAATPESGIFLIPAAGGTRWRLTNNGANPRWSPDGESIIFDFRGNIYRVPVGGGEPIAIVRGTSSTPYARWTPDGKRLIYWNRTGGDLFVVNIADLRSTSLDLITSGREVSGIALSRSGQTLVFSQGPFGGNKDLWKVGLDPQTGLVTDAPTLLSSTTTEDIECALDPSGTKIAFTVQRLERQLWAFDLNPDSGLTEGDPRPVTGEGRHNYYPAFSPDGQTLVWTSHVAGQGVLFSRDMRTEIQKKITAEWGRATREIGASFSPDSEQIIYSTTLRGSYEVWRQPSAGSIALRVTETEHPSRDTFPAWSPDGKSVALYSNRSGNWDIWSINVESGNQMRNLTDWKSSEMYPSWSPDGGQIAFRTDRQGNADFWVMGADGSDPRPFVTHPAEEGWSAWSPDGKWFYFSSNRSGVYNIWVMPAVGGEARQVTFFDVHSKGMPEAALFTKFTVSESQLILPLENRRGEIYVMESIGG